MLNDIKLEQKSLSELVVVYNTLAEKLGESLVSRFADKPSGIKRILKLLELTPSQVEDGTPAEFVDEIDNEVVVNATEIEQECPKNTKQFYIKLTDENKEFIIDADSVEVLQQKYNQNGKWQSLGRNFVHVYQAGKTKPFTVLFTSKTSKIDYKPDDCLCYIRAKSKTRALFDAINKPEGASYQELSDIINLGGMERVKSYLRYDLNRLHGVGIEQLPNNRIRAKCPLVLERNYNNDRLDYYNNNYWNKQDQLKIK